MVVSDLQASERLGWNWVCLAPLIPSCSLMILNELEYNLALAL